MITLGKGMNLQDDVGQKSPPGLVGLQNLGNTCYMNGALQALSNCPQLTRFLLDCPAYLKEKGLCHSYSELIKQIWDKPDTHYTAPTSIIRIIKCIYPDFRGCTQQDTQEFLRCFLEQLHTELKVEQQSEQAIAVKDIPATTRDDSSVKTTAIDSVLHQSESGHDTNQVDQGDSNEIVDSNDAADSLRSSNLNNNNDDNDDDGGIVNRQAFNHQDSITPTTNLTSDLNSIDSPSPDAIASDNITSANKAALITKSKSSKSSRSIISDIFEFKISSSVVCSSCNNTSTTIESFKDLSIPIPSRDHPFYSGEYNDRAGRRKNQHHVSPFCPSSPTTSSTSAATSSSPDNSELSNNRSVLGDKSIKEKVTSRSSSSNQIQQHQQANQLQHVSYPAIILYRWFWDWLGYFKHWFWTPSVALDDCLSIFFGTDPLEGDNEYSCEVCNKKNKGVKYLKILELPEVLCIHFKRYESISSSKITTHVSFPIENLDLASYMCEEARPQCTTYSLISCICHHGSALLTGHYTTYALNCYDDQWYEFDDEYVTNVDQSQVEDSEAYILFYQKSKSDLDIDGASSSTARDQQLPAK